MPAFVDIADVTLTYGGGPSGTLALEHATLAIERGEFVAVVGPSGCGKSTLLKLVSGLHLPTRGGVIVADREVAGPLSIVGMAFQNPIMLPWRTTLDNVLLPLEIVEPHASRFRRERAVYREKARELLVDRRARRLCRSLPMAIVRRHAAARVAVPFTDPRAGIAAAGRAVRRTRRLHARGALGRAANAVAAAASSP